MGCHKNIGIDNFPIQGPWLGCDVEVCFHYDSDSKVFGTVVRDDREAPGVTIIRLEDGRYVLATECQHSLPLPTLARQNVTDIRDGRIARLEDQVAMMSMEFGADVDVRDSQYLFELRAAIDDHLGWADEESEERGDYVARIIEVARLLKERETP